MALSILIVVLSARPVLNLISPNQAMNASFDPLHLVNTYGAFGSVSRERYEVIVEGTLSGDPQTAAWKEYEFPGKPGDVRRRPPQVAPYHLRLDWLLWFVPLSPAYAEGWLDPLPAPPARGRPRGARPRAGRPVPRRPAGMGPRPALPLSVHDRGRASGNGRVVGP